MINPILNNQHVRQYLLYGSIAAVFYIIPYIIFLIRDEYEEFYFLFIGTGLFMFAIFFYTLRLIKQPYDKKRTLSMIFAGHLATLVGVLMCTILVVIIFLIFHPDLFSTPSPDTIVKDMPAHMRSNQPLEVLMPIMFTTILANFGVGSFISIVSAYAGKLNQTKDKAISLETHI